jgi:hypothetical protein
MERDKWEDLSVDERITLMDRMEMYGKVYLILKYAVLAIMELRVP